MARKCKAKSSRSSEQCQAWAVRGSDVCIAHGGAARQVREKAALNVLQVRIGNELAKREIVPVTSPLAALQETAGLTLAWMAICRERMQFLSELEYSDDKSQRDVVPLITLFERSMDRSLSVLSTMVKLGIEDRVAKSAELTAEANLAAMRGLIRAARETEASEDELILGMLAGAVK